MNYERVNGPGSIFGSYVRRATIVFALQNREHGPLERGVFTHNNHIIKQTYTNANINLKKWHKSNYKFKFETMKTKY